MTMHSISMISELGIVSVTLLQLFSTAKSDYHNPNRSKELRTAVASLVTT